MFSPSIDPFSILQLPQQASPTPYLSSTTLSIVQESLNQLLLSLSEFRNNLQPQDECTREDQKIQTEFETSTREGERKRESYNCKEVARTTIKEENYLSEHPSSRKGRIVEEGNHSEVENIYYDYIEGLQTNVLFDSYHP